MSKTTESPGDPIEARCTKCRKITNHIIVAMDGETPAKVECNTCKGQHKYRKPAAKRQPANPKAAEQKEWAALQPDMNTAAAKAYSMEGKYKAQDLINHPTFGLGVVLRIAGYRKMEVLFEGGKRLMRCQ